ncbi:MAG: glycosyltransferase family 2 protein [Acidobacteriota bacterium]
MKLTAALVHYQTPGLAVRAASALIEDASSAGLGLDLAVVDNGSTAEGRRRLEALQDLGARLVEPGRNLGYAGAANLGFAGSDADAFVVVNPDVEVLPGCLEALTAALEAGAGAAGPRFFWDRPGGFQLPPTERRSRGDALLRALATRGRPWRGLALSAWRSHARRCWRAESPRRCFELSGALLAVRRDAWERVGPFDEGYRLYFEETDWLMRLARTGLRSVYVPGAEAIHAYAQSSKREPRAQGWFEESRRRFRGRWYGRRYGALLERLTTAIGEPASRGDVSPGDLGRARWLELSPSPLGFPAAGHRVEGVSDLDLPEDLERRLTPGSYHLTALDDRDRVVGYRQVLRAPDP